MAKNFRGYFFAAHCRRQPEIAMWPSTQEVYTYVSDSMTDIIHYNSDGKLEVFDQGKLAESVNK